MTREERFERIYRECAGAVLAYARRRAPRELAEEVAAETFLVCWRRLDDVPRTPLPWLYAVARKTLANRRRAEARQDAAAAALAAAAAPQADAGRDPVLAGALARLAPADRELLALVAWEGLSLREAAASVGCSHVACRVRFHRAKRRLARHLAELEQDAMPARFAGPEGATR